MLGLWGCLSKLETIGKSKADFITLTFKNDSL